MITVSIDPGTEKSAWVKFDQEKFKILNFALTPNAELVNSGVLRGSSAHLIVEVFKSYGNVIGDPVLETCVWIGRFLQAHMDTALVYTSPSLFTRKHVVTHICGGNPRAGDKHIRAALIDRFPRIGGGKTPSIGTKGRPGPLYGVTADIWAALAVAVTHADTAKPEPQPDMSFLD